MDKTEGAMEKNNGSFKAKRRGIYRFHFQARVLAGKSVWLDIKKGSAILTRTGQAYLGGPSGISASVSTQLEVGEEVHVQLYNDAIFSGVEKWIIFEGFLLAPM